MQDFFKVCLEFKFRQAIHQLFLSWTLIEKMFYTDKDDLLILFKFGYSADYSWYNQIQGWHHFFRISLKLKDTNKIFSFFKLFIIIYCGKFTYSHVWRNKNMCNRYIRCGFFYGLSWLRFYFYLTSNAHFSNTSC